jgi:hypothetical protein
MRILLTIAIVLTVAHHPAWSGERFDAGSDPARRLAPLDSYDARGPAQSDEIQRAEFRSSGAARHSVRQAAGQTPDELSQQLPGIKPIREIELQDAESEQVTPPDYARSWLASQAKQHHLLGTSREWPISDYRWAAPGVLYHPLYFEEVNLERYGYTCGVLQPAVSSAHFFGNVLLLPYHLLETPPHSCVSALGYARPGNCAPYYHSRLLPVSWAGAAAEVGTVAGLILLIP